MAGPTMIDPRYEHGVAVLDGHLWAVGGRRDEEKAPPGDKLSSCVRRDALTNVWVPCIDLPVCISGLGTVVVR